MPNLDYSCGMTTPPPRTKEESEDLIRRLDALVNDNDPVQINAIREYEAAHRNYVASSYGRFMGQFEMFFNAMTDYSHNINYLDKKQWPINRGFQFVISTSSLKQLYTSYDLLCAGSYEDSITVLRSAYEAFLRIIFISLHPECPYNAYELPGQIGAKFNATGLVRDELKLDWNTYNILSVFAHSNKYKVINDMIEIGLHKRAMLITLSYQQDDDMISVITNLINFLCTVYLDAYDQLFTVDISMHDQRDVIQSHIDKLHEYALIEHEALRTHNANEYWRQVAVDTENIFRLMKSMDSDPSLDWKDVWRQIRL